MHTRYSKTAFRLFSPIILLLCCFSTSLSAQKAITQSQLDTLLTVSKHKIKIVHISGELGLMCQYAWPYIDYLNKHKANNVEFTVILTPNPRRKGDVNWCGNKNLDFPFYTMSMHQLPEHFSYDSIPMTYFVFGDDATLHRVVGWRDKHKESLLQFVKKDAVKTVEEVRLLYEK